MFELIQTYLQWMPESLATVSIIVLKITALLVPLLLGVAYLTLAERKVIGYIQVRIGPNRVGPRGLLQPIADALKLLTKEIILPSPALQRETNPLNDN